MITQKELLHDVKQYILTNGFDNFSLLLKSKIFPTILKSKGTGFLFVKAVSGKIEKIEINLSTDNKRWFLEANGKSTELDEAQAEVFEALGLFKPWR